MRAFLRARFAHGSPTSTSTRLSPCVLTKDWNADFQVLIHRLRNEWETETETRPVILCWIVTVDTQVNCRKIPKINPSSKRAFEKYKPQGLFSEFYGIC